MFGEREGNKYTKYQSQMKSVLLQIGEPKDVMYGWCRKCREKHPEDYKQLVG